MELRVGFDAAGSGCEDGFMIPAPVLGIRGLGCGYGRVPVVERLDFDVLAGEALVLTGPNGSGKSTVLRTAAA